MLRAHIFCVLAMSACAALADTTPQSHAPIGVMGDHLHKEGELMFSYRFMRMSMRGNRDGTSDLSRTEVIQEPNVFANPPMMPPTLRVVPTEMTMDMHMFGMMYAPSDQVTLMAMTNLIKKEMDHTTFAGPMGTTVLGEFTTETSGIGDTSLSALVRLNDNWHANIGFSIPTGSIEERDNILTPMGTRPRTRLPYPMQLGSGTYDLLPGITYNAYDGAWGWGAQWSSRIRIGENEEDYTLSDDHQLQAWGSYQVSDAVSLSARLALRDLQEIDGMDPAIRAPVQTANPDNHGGTTITAFLGSNFLLPGHEHRIALEVGMPIRQDLNGPQMKSDWQVTLGWQYSPH